MGDGKKMATGEDNAVKSRRDPEMIALDRIVPLPLFEGVPLGTGHFGALEDYPVPGGSSSQSGMISRLIMSSVLGRARMTA